MIKVWLPISRRRPWFGQIPVIAAVVAATPLIPSLNVIASNQVEPRRGSVVIQRIPKETAVVPPVVAKYPKQVLVVNRAIQYHNGKVIKFGPRNVAVAGPVIPRPKTIQVVNGNTRNVVNRFRNVKGNIWLPRLLKETIAPIYPVCSWGAHFVDNGWATIQDQINAGYPIYLQPAPLVGTYERIFDFGAIFDDVIVTLIWNQNQIAGTTVVSSEIAYSTDGIGYTAYVSGRNLFVASARYVKVKFTFTGSTPHALLEFYELEVNLNVKVETDSGQVNADKDDVGGTIVLFNKVFKDVNSITITADSIEPIYPIYDFVDIPNPTQFKVLIYDSSGQRVDYLISWKARGIT